MVVLFLFAFGCDAFLHGVPDKLPPRGRLDDGQPPVITFESPKEGDVVQGTITWAVSVEDAVSGIASVEMRIDGTRIDTLFTAPYAIAWDTTTHADGPAMLEVVATDASAQANKSTKQITVRVDNDPPAKPVARIRAERHFEIEVEWDAVEDAAGYVVRYGEVEMSIATPPITLAGLLACERYTIVVSAVDDAPLPNRGDSDPLDARTRCGGDGTFTIEHAYQDAVGLNPAALALADFDGDRILDVAIAQSRTVTIYYGEGANGRGTGAFETPAQPYFVALDDDPVKGSDAAAIEVADFDEDGIADLAVTANTGPATEGRGRVAILLGTGTNGRGDGRFAPPVIYSTESGARSLLSADFNLDHVLDLAVANQISGTVTVLLGGGSNGRGDGTFTSSASYAAAPLGGSPEGLAAADFDTDGVVDLAAANNDLIGILIGNGDGTFRAAPEILTPGNDDGRTVLTGDLNADGIVDLISASAGAVFLPSGQPDFVFLGNGANGRGDGTFREWSEVQVVSGAAALADVNHDGILDVVDGINAVEPGLGAGGRGTGTFAPPVEITPKAAKESRAIATGDLNGDGILDLVGVVPQGDLYVALGGGRGGRGDGTFGTTATVPVAVGNLRGAEARDLNSDRVVDVVFTSLEGVLVALGDGADGQGKGRFAEPSRIRPTTATPASAIAIADFNTDSLPDLAVATGDVVRILAGSGDSGFREIDTSSIGAAVIEGLAVGDFDADAILDVAIAARDGGVHILLGGGTGGLGAGTLAVDAVYSVLGAEFIEIGDYDDNGIADLAVVGFSDGADLSILLGNGSSGRGDGTFQMSRTHRLEGRVTSATRGDFNADGIDDLVVSGGAILVGNGSGGRGDGTFTPAGTNMLQGGRVLAADLDRDGILDLVQLAGTEPPELAIRPGNGVGGRGDGTFGDPILYPIGGPIAGREFILRTLAAADFDSDGVTDVFAAGEILFGQRAP